MAFEAIASTGSATAAAFSFGKHNIQKKNGQATVY
jgi:hypothetical protein